MSEFAPVEQVTPSIYTLSDVSKSFGGVVVVDGATLDLRGGEILGLVGKNGAGKSTLIRMLGGALRPDSGVLTRDGRELSLRAPHDALREGIAIVHQETTLVPTLSVAENVLLGLGYPRHLGILTDFRAMDAEATAALIQLDARIDPRVPIDSLPIAQQRLVMIARGLAARARVLVLDEPSAALTDDEIAHLHAALRRLAAAGIAIVYVSHRLKEILSLTDRIALMRDGRIIEVDDTAAYADGRLVQALARTDRAAAPHPSRAPLADSGEIALETRELSGPGVTGVSMSVRRGEIVGIAGLVGAGRTELASLLAGATAPSGGEVRVGGAVLRGGGVRRALRAGVVLLPEDRKQLGLLLHDSIEENIALPNLTGYRRFRSVPFPSLRAQRRQARGSITAFLIKAEGPQQITQTLSGGNQQKVVVAKWVLHGGDVVILDEPTVGIDIEGRQEIFDIVRTLAAEGKAILYISSDFSEFAGLADRVVIMSEGRIVDEIPGAEADEERIVRICFDTATEAAG